MMDFSLLYYVMLIETSFAEIAPGMIARCLPVLSYVFRHRGGPALYHPTINEPSGEHIPCSLRDVLRDKCRPSSKIEIMWHTTPYAGAPQYEL